MAWSDAELVLETLAGDRDAFCKLVERHRRTVFALALQRGFQPEEAEDVAQEVFVRAYKNLASLQDPASFARWTYSIADHVSADALRSRRRIPESSVSDLPEPAADELPDFDFLDQDRAEVLRALAELPEEQRVVLTLRYLEGLSPKQIAERLGEPRGTVRSRLHHALGFLQTAFGANSASRPARSR